jgi:hypothetical protein
MPEKIYNESIYYYVFLRKNVSALYFLTEGEIHLGVSIQYVHSALTFICTMYCTPYA